MSPSLETVLNEQWQSAMKELLNFESHGWERTGFFDVLIILLNIVTLCLMVPRMLRKDLQTQHPGYGAGLGIMLMGLICQIPISLCRLINVRMPDALAGAWALKDIGFFIMTFSIAYMVGTVKNRDK